MTRWARRGALGAALCCGLAVTPRPAPAQNWLSPAARPIKTPSSVPSSRAASTPSGAKPVQPSPWPAAKKPEVFVRWEILGTTLESHSIEYAQFGEGLHRVLVVGAFRGDEPEGVALAQALAEHLTRFPQRLENVKVTIVRDPNPDGRARRTPTNAHGVDVDRNFLTSGWRHAADGERSASGPLPESEPETRALADLMDDLKPERVILLTTSKSQTTVAYTGPSEYLAAQVALELGGKASAVDPNGAIGSLVTMAGIDRSIPTLRIGIPPQASGDAIWSANKRGLMTAIGCGSSIEFVPVTPRPAVRQTQPQSSNQTQAVASAPPARGSSILQTAERRPAAAPSVAAPPIDVPQPLYFNQLRFGRPAVSVVSPRARRLQKGLPALEQPTIAASPASQAPVTAEAAGTGAPPTARPFDPRIQRLPPAQLFTSPRRATPPAGLPQRPIPVYPTTGY